MSKQVPEGSPPTQEQLQSLYDSVLAREPDIPPFLGIPPGTDTSNLTMLTAPLTFDEQRAPLATLRTQDQRVIALTVFRNPDTNAIVRQTIQVSDPPKNRLHRAEIPAEQYQLLGSRLGELAISQSGAQAVTANDLASLQRLIDNSEAFNPFDLGPEVIELDDLE